MTVVFKHPPVPSGGGGTIDLLLLRLASQKPCRRGSRTLARFDDLALGGLLLATPAWADRVSGSDPLCGRPPTCKIFRDNLI